MSENDIKTIIQYPDKNKVIKILDSVNFKINERKCIELVDMQGLTEQKVSDKLQVSKRTVQNYRKRAYEKLKVVLINNEEAIEILGTR